MNRSSREVNVFSVSALDLFASALGAFILISLMMIPSFPNVGPTVVEPPEPEPLPEPPTPVKQLPPLDLVIALDVTGSMGEELNGLKAEIGQMVRMLTGMAPSLGVGLVTFGDRCYEQSISRFPLRQVSGSPPNQMALLRFVDELSLRMGCCSSRCSNPDQEEDFLRGLQAATDMPWRTESERKVVVMLTDNPAYADEQQRAVEHAGRFFAQAGGREVSTVLAGLGGVSGTEAFLRRVADAGEGAYVPPGASMTGMILMALLL